MARRCSDEELLAAILQHQIERWLELEGIASITEFGEMELAGELDWEPGSGLLYLRRLADGQAWRVDMTITTRPATPEEANSRWL